VITSSEWVHWNRFGNGEHTVDINIRPDAVIAQATLYGTLGGGTQLTGIKSYRQRQPDGSDRPIDFGAWPNWPSAIFDRVSSVTFGIATGSDQQAWALAKLDHWRS
jgi:hypothetical protein